MAGEQKLQTKILKWLEDNGFWCFKTVVCNKSGIMDVVGCTPTGEFFGVEVKWGNNKPSKLQEYHIREVVKRNGIAFVAWDLETVVHRLGKYAVVKQKQVTKGDYLL